MSPAWWADNPTLAENQPEGRALRLLRRFLSTDQLWSFDEQGYFRVQGEQHSYLFLRGNQFIYCEAEKGQPGRPVFTGDSILQANYQLCIHAVEDLPPMTYREYYGSMGSHGIYYLQTTAQEALDRPVAEMYRFILLPLYDSLLAKKLLIENDERRLWKTAVVSSLLPEPTNIQQAQGGFYQGIVWWAEQR